MRNIIAIMIAITSLGLLLTPLATAGTVSYTYDDMGRLKAVDYGAAGFIEYGYDSRGNMWFRKTGTGGKGNVHPDAAVDLKDAILTLQVVCGMTPAEMVVSHADVDGDGLLGSEEILFVLQKISHE